MHLADFPLHALMEITARPPLVFVRGDGSWIWDHEGRRYLDFVQGWAVNALGHCPKEIADALAAQAATLINPSPAFWNAPSARLAQRLVERSCFDRVFFANSGAEANEGAIKLARKWGAKLRGGAFEIVTFDHAFHGRTLATMSASGKAGWDTLFEPKVPGFPKATLNDLASVERLIGERTVAVMLEPIQGEAGVLGATDDFMRALRALTRERGLLLIVDEVQTGMGRTGKLFGYEHAGIEPDIMTLGKGIGGGVPLAALLAKESVCCFEHGDQGGTYNGNPLMTAVGMAVLETLLVPGFLDEVTTKGRQLAQGLAALSRMHGLGEVRGRGLLMALDLGRDAGAKVAEHTRTNGLLLNSPRPDTLRFMPALTVSADEIELMLARLDGALKSVLAQ
ncbi:MAG TPA: acetylornithine transaminase [Burkholderiales bacterium]|nr:acetylornithine transaminase [Burkholderiales bacterium]